MAPRMSIGSFPIIVGIVVWLGLYLRDARLRAPLVRQIRADKEKFLGCGNAGLLCPLTASGNIVQCNNVQCRIPFPGKATSTFFAPRT